MSSARSYKANKNRRAFKKSIKGEEGERDSYRILDANFNRAKEALRVCEDICRFHLRDRDRSQKLRALRHKLTLILRSSSLTPYLLFKSRDAKKDIGKREGPLTLSRSFKGIFVANAQRTKEALRVIEEFLKLMDAAASRRAQRLRFDFYALEKNTIERFPALLDPR